MKGEIIKKFRIRQFSKSNNEFSLRWGIQIKCAPSVNNASRDGYFWLNNTTDMIFETKQEAEIKLIEIVEILNR